MLEELFRHRILHINKFCLPRNTPIIHDPDSILPTKQELSAYLSGQLSLFPKGSGSTLIRWKRDKVDFIELFIAVYESNAITSTSKSKLTRKEFFGLLMWFFNIQIGNLDSSLTAAKNRKIESSPYIKELLDAFITYCNKKG
ncbi:MAG: RteC domain-containing protein [Bacteroidia bacterium]